MKKKTLIVAFALFICIMAVGCTSGDQKVAKEDNSTDYAESNVGKTVDGEPKGTDVAKTPTATNTPIPTNTPTPTDTPTPTPTVKPVFTDSYC